MEDLFRNKYRTRSTRLPGWDYANSGYYFVTICTKNREELFEEIVGDKIILNRIGKIVFYEWQKIPMVRKNMILDEFIVMPNHIHGIIIIDNGELNLFEGINQFFKNKTHPVETSRRDSTPIPENYQKEDNIHAHELSVWGVSLPMCQPETPHQENPSKHILPSKTKPTRTSDQSRRDVSTITNWQHNSLGSIINQFKNNSTKRINNKFPKLYFSWQPNFYDRIIRDESGLNNARGYIISNPEKWYRDRNNSVGLGM